MSGKTIDGKFTLVLSSVIFLDQLTKFLLRYYLTPGEKISIFHSFLSLTYFTNTGAGFGILNSMNFILILITLIFVVILTYSYIKYYNGNWFFALIIAGAVSNLIDRLANGFVTDFIFFHFWPAFNVADIAITIGLIGFIVLEIRKG